MTARDRYPEVHHPDPLINESTPIRITPPPTGHQGPTALINQREAAQSLWRRAAEPDLDLPCEEVAHG
jgi:hypothetical protein